MLLIFHTGNFLVSRMINISRHRVIHMTILSGTTKTIMAANNLDNLKMKTKMTLMRKHTNKH
jgi:hypothetical protein